MTEEVLSVIRCTHCVAPARARGVLLRRRYASGEMAMMRETTAAKDRDLSTAANKTKNDPRQGRAMNNRNYAAQLAAGGGPFSSQRTRLVQRSISTLGDANREFMAGGRYDEPS